MCMALKDLAKKNNVTKCITSFCVTQRWIHVAKEKSFKDLVKYTINKNSLRMSICL